MSPPVRIIVLGNSHAGDDGAAIRVFEQADFPSHVELILAGRPGVGLIDLLDTSKYVILVDVMYTGSTAGTLIHLPLTNLSQQVITHAQFSSHGFGPSEVIRMMENLGRPMPDGMFVGIEGKYFDEGIALSDEVEKAVPQLVETVMGMLS